MSFRLPRALAVVVAALAALLLAYLLFAWLGFEPLLRWGLTRHLASHGGYQAAVGHASLNPFTLRATVEDLALREPDGQPLLSVGRLMVDFDGTSPFRRAWVFDAVEIDAPVATVVLRADGRLNWLDLVHALSNPDAPKKPPRSEPPRVRVESIALTRGEIDLTDRLVSGGFHTRAEPLSLTLQHLSTLPEDRGEHTLTAETELGTRVRWRGDLGLNPLSATGEVAVDHVLLDKVWPYLNPLLRMAPARGDATLNLKYRAAYAQGRFDLALDDVRATLAGLALSSEGASEPSVTLDAVTLAGGRLDLGRREASFERVEAGPGRVVVQRAANGDIDLNQWVRRAAPPGAGASAATPSETVPPAAAVSASASATAAPASAPPAPAPGASAPPTAASGPGAAIAGPTTPSAGTGGGWHFRLDQIDAKGIGVRFVEQGFTAPLVVAIETSDAQARLDARFGGADPKRLDIEVQRLESHRVTASSGDGTKPWAEMASATVEGGRVAVFDRVLTAESITFEGGRAAVRRDARGRIDVRQHFERVRSGAARPAKRPPREPWRWQADRVQAHDFQLALRDESVRPATSLTLVDIGLDARSPSSAYDKPVTLTSTLSVDKGGGKLDVNGQIVPGAPSGDLKVNLRDLSLAPVRALVNHLSTLTLASGRVSSQARVRFDRKGFSVDGGVDIRGVRFDETSTRDRFLSWDRLSVPSLRLTQRGIRIPEVRAEGLGAKLVVSKDRSLNVTQVFKRSKPPQAAATPPRKPQSAASAFGVDIDRVRFAGGTVDFADQSLSLPFATRIHDLKGQVVGIHRRGSAPTRLSLDGEVDDYGAARASGQVRLFDPTAYTDIKVVFRNIEMTRLTPYSATFAGRRIDSGKLSLDLEYKIEDRQLAGENQVLIDKIKLGEKVESPRAANLPLDLAITVLEDSDGRIDLGIPVSGSLDDPQFSVAGLVGKAIANVLKKIVTAPFRAIGAVFGGGKDQTPLNTVRFEVGRSDLLPPEREKLDQVAKALADRPNVSLTVTPHWDPEADAKALRERALGRAVAAASGRTLEPDEDPGPISVSDPATQAGLEKLYAQRFGTGELDALRERHVQANPPPPPADAGARLLSRLGSLFRKAPRPLRPEEAERLKGADVHTLMLERLRESQTVDEAALRALADARTAAIRTTLTSRGVAPERLQPQPAAADPGDGRTVTVSLGVAGAEAAAPDRASPDATAPSKPPPPPPATRPVGARPAPAPAAAAG